MGAPIAIFKMGTARTVVTGLGDFEDWISDGLGPDVAVRTVDVAGGDALPEPEEVAGVVVTGSSAMVTDREPWSEASGRWLAGAVGRGLPVLGICYGHQLLADALGGVVGDDPKGREIGIAEVTRTAAADRLLDGLPDVFHAQTTHQQSVLGLPPGGVLLATGIHAPIQAFRAGETAWGVQFHPEFGPEVTGGYLRARADVLRGEGIDPDARLAALRPTPHAASILPRFAAIALSGP